VRRVGRCRPCSTTSSAAASPLPIHLRPSRPTGPAYMVEEEKHGAEMSGPKEVREDKARWCLHHVDQPGDS
jgi:hypothetical protein